MSKAAELAALIGSQTALSNRNLIINGAMQVAQRGTSDSAAAANSFIVDRFMFSKSGVDNLVVTTSQSTDSPDGFSNSYKIEATTAESALGANDLAYVRTKLEAQNLQHLNYGTSAAQKVTASFWVKASSAGQYTLTLFQDDGSDLVNKTYSVSSTNTWEYKTITFPEHTTTAIANDNGFGLSLNWIILAGTDFTSDSGAQGAWDDTYANAKFANGHTVTSPFMTTNGTFQITGVQMELGEQETPFEHRSFGDELQRCQRYYQSLNEHPLRGTASSGTSLNRLAAVLPVIMRVAPTVTFSGTCQWYDGASTGTITSVSNTYSEPHSVEVDATVASGTTAQSKPICIYNDGKDGTFKMDAEL